MIDLTPLEVRQKKSDFRRVVRGYEPAPVDEFLQVVADRLEALVRDNMTLTEEVARLRDRLSEYEERERALTEALVTAQEMREEVREQARKEADLVRREAESDARRIIDEANRAREREEEELRRLRARRRELIRTYRLFLERELGELTVAERALGTLAGGRAGSAEDAVLAGVVDVDTEPEREPVAGPHEGISGGDGPEAADAARDRPGAARADAAQPDWLSSLLEEEV